MEALEKLFVHLFQGVQNNKCSTYKQLSNNSATSTARICAHRIHLSGMDRIEVAKVEIAFHNEACAIASQLDPPPLG
ncbi:hypothetical protein T4E_10925 [Trichinella pseudospiralis]|uniref:Uncharacterized protein n=1 Tax=Trichinella pseudospiralis TaxID=6337 RepID=A0A0V0YJ76_TRIPS|nr:hypothetical protein T4E_10925 [Trichinella pseudospiralis]